jgi:AcrR family transcriptional regulator
MANAVQTIPSRERIREAALEGFAADGVAATSIRDVAARAGVSPGLVQHNFASKDTLREAVDDHVRTVAAAAFADFPAGGSATEVQRELGDRVTAIVRDHPAILRYVARSLAAGEAAGLALFDAFVAISGEQWRRLQEEGLLREDADLLWVGLQTVVLNLATVLFEGAIDRHLPEPYRSPEMLERWNRASSALFQRGMYRGEDRC